MALRIEVDWPGELGRLELSRSLDDRLQSLLDRRDDAGLSESERSEAEGLVELAEWLTLLRLRAERLGSESPATP